MFCDPDTFQPFLSLKDLPSQDAESIKYTINAAFNDISMPELASKVIFLASDGASVNSGVKSGLAVKFHEAGVPWLVFVWCFSHRFELALEDHLEEVIEPVKKCLTTYSFVMKNSPKNYRNYDSYIKFYLNCINSRKPSKCNDMHWIAHLLCSCLV